MKIIISKFNVKNLFYLFILNIILLNQILYAGVETTIVAVPAAGGAAVGGAQVGAAALAAPAATTGGVAAGAAGATGAAGTTGAAGASKGFATTSTSLWVLGLSAVGGIYAGILYTGAEKQITDSKFNITKIEELLASFKDASSMDCVDGRTDLKVPECYCLNTNGSNNTAHSNSQVCKDFWAKRDYKVTADADKYRGQVEESTDVNGCLTTANKFDPGCKCKKFTDTKGNNACKKSMSIALPESMATNMTKNTGISDLLKYTNGIGSANGGTLNGASLNAKAISSRKLQNEISKLLSPEMRNSLPVVTDKNVAKYAKALLGEKAYNEAMKDSGSSNLGSIGRDVDPKMAEALKKAQSKAGLEMIGSGKGNMKKIDGEKMANFNFNDSAPASAGSNNVEFAGEKVYKVNSDITKDTGATIFQIISNRYLESGINRLFNDEQETK